MNPIQMLNTWRYLYRQIEEEGLPIWFWGDDYGGNFSYFDSSPIDVTKWMLRDISFLLYAAKEADEFPIWFWIDNRANAWFSWIYQRWETDETPKTWEHWKE